MNTIKTGVELIAEERKEQIEKHGRTVERDVRFNHGQYEIDGERFNLPQLVEGARLLLYFDDEIMEQHIKADVFIPHGWDKEVWHKMLSKPRKERIIIAGALLAAEIDRLQNS